jgi:hypothetical protein
MSSPYDCPVHGCALVKIRVPATGRVVWYWFFRCPRKNCKTTKPWKSGPKVSKRHDQEN